MTVMMQVAHNTLPILNATAVAMTVFISVVLPFAVFKE